MIRLLSKQKYLLFIFLKIFLFIFSAPLNVFADEAKDWLKVEIDKIIYAYQNNDLPSENRFLMIEQTINNNFAGTGIAKFVAGKSWNGAPNAVKKEYIKLFKRHFSRRNVFLKVLGGLWACML